MEMEMEMGAIPKWVWVPAGARVWPQETGTNPRWVWIPPGGSRCDPRRWNKPQMSLSPCWGWCVTPGLGSVPRLLPVETLLQRAGLIIHTTLLSYRAFSSTISWWNLFQHLWLIFLPFKLSMFANESCRVFHSLFHTRVTGCQEIGEKEWILEEK